MFIALARSSMSPVIYEVLDYACGLTDAKGNLISQGNGVTSFIGMLSPMVQRVIEKFDNGKNYMKVMSLLSMTLMLEVARIYRMWA